MDGQTQPSSLEGSPPSSLEESTNTKPKKRPFKDISIGFIKAVIICNSTELTRSESNTYRPNNIVIELLKKNPMRYGKVTFHKFTSEKEIREELSSRFPILKNRTFWFASADQYGKLNFRELEEWSGRNLRRWLPGSSAMYIILETSSRVDNGVEEQSNSELSRVSDSSSSYSRLTCTTVRAGTSTTHPISWHDNNSQRALLDFLSSPEKVKLCNTQRMKMFAINAGQPESKQSQSLKSSARINDLRSQATCTKNERVNTDLESDSSSRQDCYSSNESLHDEANFPTKRKRTLHSSINTSSFSSGNTTVLNDSNLELKQSWEKKKEKKPDVTQRCHDVEKKVSSVLYDNFKRKDNTAPSTELFITEDTGFATFGPSSNSKESLISIDKKKDSSTIAHASSHDTLHRTNPGGSKMPRYFSPPYYMMSNPREMFSNNPSIRPLAEETQKQSKLSNGHDDFSSHTPVSPMQAIYVPSTGVFPWGQINHDNALQLPDKGPSLAFVPFGFVSPYSASSGLFPYGFNTADMSRNEALRNILAYTNKTDKNIQETDLHEEEKEKQQFQDERTKDSQFPCSTEPAVSTATPQKVLHNTSKLQGENKVLVQKFSGMDKGNEDDENLQYNCEIFPCTGPCEGGQSFVILLDQPLEDRLKQASFFAKFNDISAIELTRVDYSTLKGKAVPESLEPGHVIVRIEADGHVLGSASYTYTHYLIDRLNKVMFSGKHCETLLRLITSSEEERTKMQDEVTDMLELMLYLSAENGSTSIIDNILGSAYGDLVKARCSGRIFQPHQVARKSRHVELSEYLKNKLTRKDFEGKESAEVEETTQEPDAAAIDALEQKKNSLSSSDSNGITHAQDCSEESRDSDRKIKEDELHVDLSAGDFEEKNDNLLLLSSIASRMENNATLGVSENKNSSSSTSKITSNGTTSAGAANNLTKDNTDNNDNVQETSRPRAGFLKKVFVLPPNSLYLPSQSELCKLRGTRSSYCKVLFNAEMSEEDVYGQIRKAFGDLLDVSFHLAVVDQTGKLVFYDGIWTGKVIRRKLRGNSVLYVVPIDEEQDDEEGNTSML